MTSAVRSSSLVGSDLTQTPMEAFVTGAAGGLLEIQGRRGPYWLAYSDPSLPAALARNQRAGWFSPDLRTTAFSSKTAQHRAIRLLVPRLAFDGWSAPTPTQAVAGYEGPLVIRPDLSMGSRGSAVMVMGGEAGARAAETALVDQMGPFQVHRFIEGTPFFVNTVVVDGTLQVADCWRCGVTRTHDRLVLTSVINLLAVNLDPALKRDLSNLAAGLGYHNGPLHFELVDTAFGPKLVKFSPRLATHPLPALCRLGGIAGQVDLFLDAFGAEARHAPPARTYHVADFSFFADRSGRLKGLAHQADMEALASFSHFDLPAQVGTWVRPGSDGYSYAATLFLRHADRSVVERDLITLEEMARDGAVLLDG